MRKTDKKIEAAIVAALTDVCELALIEVANFQWITHFVDYRQFPESLLVVCVFDTQANLAAALKAGTDEYLYQQIKAKLAEQNIPIKHIRKQVKFDSEELGNWIN